MAMYVDRCCIKLSLKLERDSLYIYIYIYIYIYYITCVRYNNEENKCPSTKLVSVTS
jgi:hypothetical protein